MIRWLYGAIALGFVLLLVVGGYYAYLNYKISRSVHSKQAQKVKPTPTPIPPASVTQKIEKDTPLGACEEFKDNSLVTQLELIKQKDEFIVAGTLYGTVKNFTYSSDAKFAKFNLVSSDGQKSKIVSLKEKEGLVQDAKLNPLPLKDLKDDTSISLQFDCFPNAKPEASFLPLKILLNPERG